jgi:hypothetical protein
VERLEAVEAAVLPDLVVPQGLLDRAEQPELQDQVAHQEQLDPADLADPLGLPE